MAPGWNGAEVSEQTNNLIFLLTDRNSMLDDYSSQKLHRCFLVEAHTWQDNTLKQKRNSNIRKWSLDHEMCHKSPNGSSLHPIWLSALSWGYCAALGPWEATSFHSLPFLGVTLRVIPATCLGLTSTTLRPLPFIEFSPGCPWLHIYKHAQTNTLCTSSPWPRSGQYSLSPVSFRQGYCLLMNNSLATWSSNKNSNYWIWHRSQWFPWMMIFICCYKVPPLPTLLVGGGFTLTVLAVLQSPL